MQVEESKAANLLACNLQLDLQLAGTWLLLVGAPLAWLWLVMDSIRHKKEHGFALAGVALGLPVLFALLLAPKTFNCSLTIVPIAALGLGVGLARLFASRSLLLRVGAMLVLLGCAGQAMFDIVQMQQRAAQNDFQRFLQAHHARVISTVLDQEHNPIRIYELRVPVASRRLRSLAPRAP